MMSLNKIYNFRKRLLVLGILYMSALLAYADGGDRENSRQLYDWSIGVSGHAAALMNHHNNMSILAEEHPYLVDVFVARKTHGDQAWQRFFNNPDYGLSATFIDFGSPTYLGRAYSLYPFMNFHLLNSSSAVNIAVGLGGGPAYVEKTFNTTDNYKNVAIGSHINAFLRLQLQLDVRLTDRIDLFGGFALSHLSNGSFKKPNAGVNMMSLSAGASYAFGQTLKQQPVEQPEESMDKRWNYRLYLSGGVKEISPIGGDKYLVSGVSLEVSKQHLPFTRFGGTLDVVYDFSDYQNIQNLQEEGYEEVTRAQTVKLGVAAGYELQFGHKVSAVIQAGVYLYAKDTENGITYQRLALRYAASNRINVHFGLKSQLGVADYVELGVGYKLR